MTMVGALCTPGTVMVCSRLSIQADVVTSPPAVPTRTVTGIRKTSGVS